MKSSVAFVRHHVVPAIVCLGLAAVLGATHLLQRFEAATFDLRTQLRMQIAPRAPSGEVVIVAIDEDSLKEIGRWPWSRDVHGAFLQLVGQVKPAVVTWDILFTEPTPQDASLVTGITTAGGPVVLGTMRVLDDEGVGLESEAARAARLVPLPRVEGDRSRLHTSRHVLLPAGALAELAHLAFVDTPADLDGARRRVPLVVQIGDRVFPTLSLKTLMLHWRARPEDVRVRIGEAILIETERGRRRIPIDETGSYLINYRYGKEALSGRGLFSYGIAFRELRARWEKQPADVPPLAGKILLVGQTADALSDIGPTPMSELTPLVFVHANAIENMLAEDYARHVPAWPVWLGAMLLGVAGSVRLADRRLAALAVFSIGVPILYVLSGLGVWLQGSWLVPLVGPVAGFVALQIWIISRRVIAEQRAKEQIKGMFGTYLSPELVNRLVASGEMPRLGGHEVNLTAYFSDIQGFSTFSEILPPDRLVELMNEYLTACTDIVQEEGGTLDKYIGDAVVTMFGAPIALPDHAQRACVAACRVQQKVAELRAKWRSEGERWPEIVWRMQARIGLNTGPCIVGNMGSRARFNYTMMGDNVNLAARMESGAKAWGVYAMCTEATKLACEQHGGGRVVFRALGRVVVMGRSQPVPIFEIMGLREALDERVPECIRHFDTALASYHARDWQAAAAEFRRAAELEPNQPGSPGVKTNPSLAYLERCAEWERRPPPPDWDGRHVMTDK